MQAPQAPLVKDPVLSSMVTRFVNGHGLDSLSEDRQFEAFVAHMVIRRYHQEYHDQLDIADVENFLVGGTDDAALDAIGIFLNGLAVHTETDVDEIAEKNRHVQVQYVFVQAKRSPSFDSGGIVKFTRGVRWFCRSALDLARSPNSNLSRYNESVHDRVRLAGYIHRSYGDRMPEEPTCFLYYASTGVWSDDSEPAHTFEDGRLELEQSPDFDLHSVFTFPLGRDNLKAIYRHLDRAVEKTVTFLDYATIPATPQVDAAYIGVVAGDEFVRLLSTDTGDLDRQLFYDNVRDFQGDDENEINKAIAETLIQDSESFPFMNNGITIVAHDASSSKESYNGFRIQDFQIVNGCQTSYVLFNNKDKIDDRTFVPVKLIVTTERKLATEVIRGTNSQTPVKAEELRLLTQFHVELEDFYKAEEANRQPDEAAQVHYERRSGQYRYTLVDPKRIVSARLQTAAMVAMFLDQPEYYRQPHGTLFDRFGGDLYQMAEPKFRHQMYPYYTSGLAALMYQEWHRTQEDRQEITHFRGHTLMRLRVSIAGRKMPSLSNAKMEAYCRKIVDAIGDEQRWAEACRRAVADVQDQLKHLAAEKDRELKIQDLLTQPGAAHELVERLGGNRRAHAAVDVRRRGARGTITSFNNSQFRGLIQTENGEIITVYGTDHGTIPLKQWKPGTRVWVKVGEDDRPERTGGRKKATEVELAE